MRARHGFEEETTRTRHIQEFILDTYSYSQLSEIIDVSPSVSDIDADIDNERDTVQTGSTQWTYYPNLICCACNPRLNAEPSGLKQNRAPHILKYSTPLSVFMFFMLSVFICMQHLVEETNRYYHQCLDMTGEGHVSLPDVNVQEIYFFLSVVMWVGHSHRDTLKDY
jgi:hypothetical protein